MYISRLRGLPVIDADGDRIYDPDETRTPDGSYTPTVRPELRPATSAGVVTAPQRVGIDELMSPADKAAKKSS